MILEDEIKKDIMSFVNGKKNAGEGIEETKVSRKVGNRIENKIRYFSLDNIIKKTIVEFCFKNPCYGINIKADAIQLHNNPRHSKNGIKSGTKRGSYRELFAGLKKLSCMKHGKFNEKSHRQHHLQIHQKSEDENISYTTYQKHYIKGYKEWKQGLKSCEPEKLALRTKKVSNISRCQKCGIQIKLKLAYGYKKLKNGKKRRYKYYNEIHILNIVGCKIEVSSCTKAKSVFDQFNSNLP